MSLDQRVDELLEERRRMVPHENCFSPSRKSLFDALQREKAYHLTKKRYEKYEKIKDIIGGFEEWDEVSLKNAMKRRRNDIAKVSSVSQEQLTQVNQLKTCSPKLAIEKRSTTKEEYIFENGVQYDTVIQMEFYPNRGDVWVNLINTFGDFVFTLHYSLLNNEWFQSHKKKVYNGPVTEYNMETKLRFSSEPFRVKIFIFKQGFVAQVEGSAESVNKIYEQGDSITKDVDKLNLNCLPRGCSRVKISFCNLPDERSFKVEEAYDDAVYEVQVPQVFTRKDHVGEEGKEERKEEESAFLFVAVPSEPNNFLLRQAIRATWAQHEFIYSGKVMIKFFIGESHNKGVNSLVRKERQAHEDVILLPFEDSFEKLAEKFVQIMKYVSSGMDKPPQFLIKTEDDSYLNISKVIELIKENEKPMLYMGDIVVEGQVDRSISSKRYVSELQFNHPYYPIYASGPTFLLSIDLIKEILKEDTSVSVGLDDTSLGFWIQSVSKRMESVHIVNTYFFKATYEMCVPSSSVVVHPLDHLNLFYFHRNTIL